MALPGYGPLPRKSSGYGRSPTEGGIEGRSFHGQNECQRAGGRPVQRQNGRLVMTKTYVGLALGAVLQCNFPLLGTYWTAADIILQHIAKKEGGFDKLKGKKIALVYHDSPYGKEPIALLTERAKRHGFENMFLPVTHPGVEQKATWLQIRQNRPDYVLLWGWCVMNSTAIKEAVAVGYPREKMYGVWWSGAEQDVRPAEDGAKGYNSAALQHTAGQFKLHEDLK